MPLFVCEALASGLRQRLVDLLRTLQNGVVLFGGDIIEEVVDRVATKGGITEEGTKVVYESFPGTAGRLFDNTLEKRRMTAEKAERDFCND